MEHELEREIRGAVCRITSMEACLEDVMQALACGCNVQYDREVMDKLRILAAYMDSGQWQKDYELDEAGKLPADLKRGILAQDTLYDLLTEIDRRKE